MFLLSKFPERQKDLNMWLGSIAAVFISREFKSDWWKGHLIHHKKPLIAEDLQNCPAFVLVGKDLVKTLLRTWLLPGFLLCVQDKIYDTCPEVVIDDNSKNPKRNKNIRKLLPFFTLWLIYGIICYTLSNWVAFLGLNLLYTLNVIKISLEHGCNLRNAQDVRLRSRTSFSPLRWFIMLFNITLHFEHHINCTVPWYNLKKYHLKLKSIIPQEYHDYCYNDNFRKIIKQLSGKNNPALPTD